MTFSFASKETVLGKGAVTSVPSISFHLPQSPLEITSSQRPPLFYSFCSLILLCHCCQSLSCVRLFVTPWTAARQASLSFIISRSLLKLMSIHEWCHPTTSFSVIPFPSCPQSLSVFSNELALHIRWPKYWGFSFSISPSSEYLWKVTMLLKSSSKTIPQYYTIGYFGFPCGSAAKKSVCNAGNLVWSLGWDDPLEKGKATNSSILAWRIPWTVESMGLQRVGHSWMTFTSLSLLGSLAPYQNFTSKESRYFAAPMCIPSCRAIRGPAEAHQIFAELFLLSS